MIDADAIQNWLGIPAYTAPARDPKGEAIAYLSTETGMAQVWLLENGQSRQLTDHPEPVNSIAWSPAGGQILFTSCIGGDERWQLLLLDVATGAVRALTADPMTVHMWGAWSADGSKIAFGANRDCKKSLDLQVMDVASGKVTRLGDSEGHQEALGFTADGAQVLSRRMTAGGSDHEITLVALADGTRVPVLAAAKRVKTSAARLLKAGGGLAVCDFDGDRMALWRFDTAGQSLGCVLSEDTRDVDAFTLTPGQDGAVVALNDQGYSTLKYLDLGTGETRDIALPVPGVVGALSLPGKGDRLLCSITSAVLAPSVWWIPLDGSPAECLLGAEMPAAVIAPTLHAFASFDGEEIPYFLYTPAGEKPVQGWPVIFIIHGGPEMQWRPDFRADVQWMLSQGIAVVAPNVRGSTGYGRRFHELDDRAKRLDALADVTALRAHLLADGKIDAAHCGIFGRSYGGWMVMAALTERPEDWTIGINFYGIGNFFTHLLATGPWARQMRAEEYGHPETEADLLTRISPIFRADNIVAPLLLVHADRDPRVPPGESETINSVLFGLGKRCDFLRIAHAGHGFLRLDHNRKVFGTLAEYISNEL